MEPKQYFSQPGSVKQRQYEALRAFFLEGSSAAQAARQFGYSLQAFYSLVRDFKTQLAVEPEPFFAVNTLGRKPKDPSGELKDLITSLRKKYLSVPEITSILKAHGYEISEKYVYTDFHGKKETLIFRLPFFSFSPPVSPTAPDFAPSTSPPKTPAH